VALSKNSEICVLCQTTQNATALLSCGVCQTYIWHADWVNYALNAILVGFPLLNPGWLHGQKPWGRQQLAFTVYTNFFKGKLPLHCIAGTAIHALTAQQNQKEAQKIGCAGSA